jgi:hypothetical protein
VTTRVVQPGRNEIKKIDPNQESEHVCATVWLQQIGLFYMNRGAYPVTNGNRMGGPVGSKAIEQGVCFPNMQNVQFDWR